MQLLKKISKMYSKSGDEIKNLKLFFIKIIIIMFGEWFKMFSSIIC